MMFLVWDTQGGVGVLLVSPVADQKTPNHLHSYTIPIPPIPHAPAKHMIDGASIHSGTSSSLCLFTRRETGSVGLWGLIYRTTMRGRSPSTSNVSNITDLLETTRGHHRPQADGLESLAHLDSSEDPGGPPTTSLYRLSPCHPHWSPANIVHLTSTMNTDLFRHIFN